MDKVWKFSAPYLVKCKKMSSKDILSYLEDYRTSYLQPNPTFKTSQASKKKSILISMKVQQDLLEEFKKMCNKKGIKYQTQIKILMDSWIQKNRSN